MDINGQYWSPMTAETFMALWILTISRRSWNVWLGLWFSSSRDAFCSTPSVVRRTALFPDLEYARVYEYGYNFYFIVSEAVFRWSLNPNFQNKLRLRNCSNWNSSFIISKMPETMHFYFYDCDKKYYWSLKSTPRIQKTISYEWVRLATPVSICITST